MTASWGWRLVSAAAALTPSEPSESCRLRSLNEKPLIVITRCFRGPYISPTRVLPAIQGAGGASGKPECPLIRLTGACNSGEREGSKSWPGVLFGTLPAADDDNLLGPKPSGLKVFLSPNDQCGNIRLEHTQDSKHHSIQSSLTEHTPTFAR